jgi:zinc ribbon protein
MHCPTCHAETPSSDRFCRHCGSPLSPTREDTAAPVLSPTAADNATPSAPASTPPAARYTHPTATTITLPASGTSSAGTPQARAIPLTGSTSLEAPASTAQRALLPRFPCKLIWSPRKPWSVTTKLSESDLAKLFEERMTRRANLLRQFNDYFRVARWEVRRNAISGENIATCRPTGLVSVGFGKSKQYVDVSENTIICQIDRPTPDGQTEVTVGVGSYTTLFLFFYAFPATVYTFDIVKAIKRADRDATIKYPWSITRMILLAALTIFLLAAAAGGGSGSSNSANGGGASPAEVAGSTGAGRGEASPDANSTELPARPANDPTELAQQINKAEEVIHDPSSSPKALAAAGGLEQLATRTLFRGGKSLQQQTFARLSTQALQSMHTTVAAADALKSIVPPQKQFPKWKILEPPSPDTLLSYFRAAQERYGVPWGYLAAIQLVETRMGRIHGDSTAGAQGPMQFIPATWARYGHGSIDSYPDSIMAAARLLVADGAPARIDDALYHYNPSPGYVTAIDRYAQRMQEDERAFYGYYYWQVLYKHVGGSVILPTGYPSVAPEAIE